MAPTYGTDATGTAFAGALSTVSKPTPGGQEPGFAGDRPSADAASLPGQRQSVSLLSKCFGNQFLVDSGDTYHACHLDLNDRMKVELGNWGRTSFMPTVRIIFALSIASSLKKSAIGMAARKRKKSAHEHAADRH
jgi:hypothetical protein